MDLVFHNAYGPDKPWFYDMSLSGGGCLMDLGIHLIDLALWVLPDARVEGVRSRLFAGGARLHGAGIEGPGPGGWPVEDYGVAELDLGGGTVVRLASSWGLPAGSDAVIEASFYGTRGGASFRNLEGSFYDFRAEALEGTARRSLAEPPDDWGGRAAVSWVSRLGEGVGYDPEVEGLVEVARTLDRIYGR